MVGRSVPLAGKGRRARRRQNRVATRPPPRPAAAMARAAGTVPWRCFFSDRRKAVRVVLRRRASNAAHRMGRHDQSYSGKGWRRRWRRPVPPARGQSSLERRHRTRDSRPSHRRLFVNASSATSLHHRSARVWHAAALLARPICRLTRRAAPRRLFLSLSDGAGRLVRSLRIVCVCWLSCVGRSKGKRNSAIIEAYASCSRLQLTNFSRLYDSTWIRQRVLTTTPHRSDFGCPSLLPTALVAGGATPVQSVSCGAAAAAAATTTTTSGQSWTGDDDAAAAARTTTTTRPFLQCPPSDYADAEDDDDEPQPTTPG
jgi:hypothetical protein